MARKKRKMLPRLRRILETLGENIRLARLRRRLSAEQVAERAGISRPTLAAIERGEPGVGIGNYLEVLRVLGLDQDLLQVAKDDVLGRKLQDLEISVRRRAPKRKKKRDV